MTRIVLYTAHGEEEEKGEEREEERRQERGGESREGEGRVGDRMLACLDLLPCTNPITRTPPLRSDEVLEALLANRALM